MGAASSAPDVMTLPVYLAAHLIYGMLMGSALLRRMRAEGEVIGVPLLVTLGPVAMLTAPLGAVLLRYAGGWFLHGQLLGDGGIAYERFHFGLMIAVGICAGLATVGGMFFAIAVLSRDKPRMVRLVVVLVVVALALVVDRGDIASMMDFRQGGGPPSWILRHPAAVVSLAVAAVLAGSHQYAKKKIAPVLPRPTGPGSILAMR
jgi:hypothetical protein